MAARRSSATTVSPRASEDDPDTQTTFQQRPQALRNAQGDVLLQRSPRARARPRRAPPCPGVDHDRANLRGGAEVRDRNRVARGGIRTRVRRPSAGRGLPRRRAPPVSRSTTSCVEFARLAAHDAIAMRRTGPGSIANPGSSSSTSMARTARAARFREGARRRWRRHRSERGGDRESSVTSCAVLGVICRVSRPDRALERYWAETRGTRTAPTSSSRERPRSSRR